MQNNGSCVPCPRSKFCFIGEFFNLEVYNIPYSGKFSLVQIFAEKRPGSSEEIFAVFIFSERGTL